MPAPSVEEKIDLSAVQQKEGLGRIQFPDDPTESSPFPSRSHNGTGMKRWKKILLISSGALALVILAVGGIVWSRRGVVTVQTGKVAREDLSAIVTASGQVEPVEENQANVNANSFGKLTELLIKEGDRVKEGQLLMRTESVQQQADVEAQQAALKTAQADTDAAQAAVQSAGAAMKTSQADLETAQANFRRAKDDYARAQQLLEDNLIAQQVFDQRRNDFQVGKANVDAAQARVSQTKAQYQQAVYNRDMAKARVAQNRAMLLRAQDVRAKTEYYSPIDGIVTSLPVHLGENVVPGIQNQVGSLLYQVSDLSVMTAEVKVDETDIVNVKLGQPSDVLIDAFPDKTFKGRVTEIGQSAVGRTSGLTSSQTQSGQEEAKDFKVVVTLNDPPPNLRPGLSATAKITTATRNEAVTVPIQALAVRMLREIEESNKNAGGKKVEAASTVPTASSASSGKEKDKGKEELQGVFVIRDGRAVFTQVKTGIMGTTNVEILSGVKPGDEIVTGSFSVLRNLKNHTKVKIDNSGLKPGGPTA